MATSNRPPRDPFGPPDPSAAPSLDLAKTPARGQHQPDASTNDETPLHIPEARKPVKYKKPGTGWVTLVLVGFAFIGAIGVFTAVLYRGRNAKLPSMDSVLDPVTGKTRAGAKPAHYEALSKDDAVLIEIDVSPKHAVLLIDGDAITSNPARLLRGAAPHKLTAAAEGYTPSEQQFTADAHKKIRIKLVRDR